MAESTLKANSVRNRGNFIRHNVRGYEIIPSEDRESQTLAQWLTLKGYLFCHVPNETMGSVAWYKKRARMGVRPGVPDFLIFELPATIMPKARGIAIEMKRQKRAVVTDCQEKWLADLAERGWYVHVAYGADDAIQWLEGLGL